MKQRTKKLIEQALDHARNGRLILPVHSIEGGRCSCRNPKCARPGKHPVTKHGVKDASKSKKQIQKWWKKHPTANVAVATGKKSGIVVFDIDPRNGGTESLKVLKAKLGKLPKTIKSKTGGNGVHYFFEYPDDDMKTHMGRNGKWAGIDIMSDGGYVIVPPSVHKTGGAYEWINAPKNTELRPIRAAWLKGIRRISDKGKKATRSNGAGVTGNTVLEGNRNNTLTQIAGTLSNKGLSRQAIMAALLEENRVRCKPPLDKTEVKKIAKSISRYASGGKFAEISDPSYRLAKIVLAEQFGDGRFLKYTPDGQFWKYDGNGLWENLSEKVLEGEILEVIRRHSSEVHHKFTTAMKDVLQLLRAELATSEDVFRLRSKALPVINCTNGTVWFNSDGSHEFKPHHPEDFLTYIIPVEYDASAQCPRFREVLLEIFGRSSAPKSMSRHWFEIMGYILQPSRKSPLVVILFGTGANGKTALYRVLVELLGWDRVFSGSVVSLEKDRFGTGNLFGKLLFVDDDVSEGIQLPDGALKKYSEEKLVSGEKKYRDPIQFLNRAIPMLLCNNVPFVRDLSYGLRRRLMVIPFDRMFELEEQDEGLVDYLRDNELAGILNAAIAGFARYKSRGQFDVPKPVFAALQTWFEKANSLELFLSEECNKIKGGTIALTELYKSYEAWAERSGIKSPITRHTLKRNIELLGFAVSRDNKGTRVRGLAMKK